MSTPTLKIAVIATGGKQYLVKEGDTLLVEALPAGKISLKDLLRGGSVEAEVGEGRRGRKVRIVKFRAKTRELKRAGHRQQFVRLTITKIL